MAWGGSKLAVPTPNLGPSPDMVWGHNLQQHMAPFGALTSGFCMVFDSPILIFWTPDPIFGARSQGLGPRRPGGPFWADMPRLERDFVDFWLPWNFKSYPRPHHTDSELNLCQGEQDTETEEDEEIRRFKKDANPICLRPGKKTPELLPDYFR